MDEDLVVYLEKKIKNLEAERDHWKANHDNQVKPKAAIADRPNLGGRAKRVTELVAEVDQCRVLNDLYEKQILETNCEIARLFDSLFPSSWYMSLVREANNQANVAFDWIRAHSEIERLKAERDHWKANHDHQVKLKAAIADRPDLGDRAKRVAELVAEVERLKAELKSFDINHNGESQLAFFINRAKEFEEKSRRFRVMIDKAEERIASLETENMRLKMSIAPRDSVIRDGVETPSPERISERTVERVATKIADDSLEAKLAEKPIEWPLPGDPRGDGDSGSVVTDTESADEDAMRRRLMWSFLGSEAENLGATSYKLRDGERWEFNAVGQWVSTRVPTWEQSRRYRLANGGQP